MGRLRKTPAELAGQHQFQSIMDASHYARQLRAYLDYFHPDQILVLDFETLLSAPQGHLDAILRHIGAEPMGVPTLSAHNGNDELERVPKSMLRLTHGRLRPLLTRLVGPKMRGQLRRLMARGPRRGAPGFPDALLQSMRDDLAEDTRRLRHMTGQEFSKWSI
ncbi:hypothetical protein SAMN06265221_11828 [Paracoccus laeviglucosivorans]|uniref:Sulfotransferase domain-containing protein n=2 Tax=Paracoccus laeviglucosivorans TaxID=1197861 RepID=A0A521F531_9RHOB|nr:hypothetical protein SAMN06265221_11828 [Paracoccus laeviglucosivorans]